MMSSQFTCSYCRKQEIHCDGARPQCGTCAAQILACNYAQMKPRKNPLAKGNACIPCRRAKIRCDANRPRCGPCQKPRNHGTCIYDQPPRRTNNPRIAKKPSTEETFGALVGQSDDTAFFDPESDSSTFPTSDLSHDHRNMVFRLIHLSHDLVYGNIQPSAKTQAIMLGDISGTVISPFFVYYAEISGRHHYQLSRMDFSLWGSQGVLTQLTFRFLSMIRLEDEPLTFAQAHWMTALAMMVVGNPNLAWKHYRRAVIAIKRHDIRFVPNTLIDFPRIPSVTAGFIPSEEDHERVAFLSKILYLEAFLSFYVSGLPGTRVWATRDQENRLPGCADGIRQDLGDLCGKLERQFRLELPAVYPLLWETCPLILRTRTFLWLKDVKKYLEELHMDAKVVDSRMRAELIVPGSGCLQHMLGLARKYSDIGDWDRCLILRSNAMLTITGLLELHRSAVGEGVILNTGQYLESRQKCEELLVLLANTAQQKMEGEGKRIKDFITHDYGRDQVPCRPQTIVCLVSTGGFASTLLPVPSHPVGTVNERVVEQFLSSPLQKVVEINFNLAAKGLWGNFIDATMHAAGSSTNYLLKALE